MLVATIAATATYKLLTSGGLSSASRMKQQEAYQSALAGIENTRMWMTFHANDVGALIKAFIEGGNKPINLDARVRRWQRAKQDYHVWLTGVNTENSTYKLKILSSGVSQVLGNTNDVTVATWNESAIFNVDGLYQVKLLNEEVIVNDFASLPFEYNYFGGSTQSQGHIKAYSFLINGDMFGSNPPYTEKNLIVTGDVHITGNSVGAGGTACIGGNISADNGVFGNDFYVAGNATKGFTFPAASEAAGLSRAYLTGNVYIEGNLAPPDPGDQKFLKNMTLNGIWKTNLGAHESQVAGNLCLGPKAKVIIDKKNAVRKFKVGGNVWAESTYPIGVGENCNVNGNTVSGNCFEKNEAEYDHIILGDKTDSRIYIKSAHSTADYVTLVNNRTFVESKDYYRGTSGNVMGMGPQAKWDNKTTKVYKDLPPHLKTKTDAYYLYYYGGSGQDVDFIVSSAGGWGFGPQTKYASYYVENVPFYTTGGGGFGFGYQAAGNHLLNMSGNTPTGSPFCKASPDKWRPECDVSPWFQSKGTIYRTFPAENNRGFECAESVKAHCDSVWRKDTGKGCPHKGKSTVNSHFRDGNADYKVDDILVTAYSKFVNYANKGCKNVQWDNTMSERLNRCYRDNTSNSQRAKDSLYNGYQVVLVKNSWKADPKTPLKGKFIIIVTDEMGQQSLPPTTSDSYVFLYLTHGTKKSQGNINTLQAAVQGGIYNYFIYSKEDIDGLMFNDEIFSGSIYATAETCAKVGDIKTRQMVFNEAMMSDLSANAVVCPVSKNETPSAKELICGGVVTSSSSAAGSSTSESFSSGSGSTSSEFDSYYISMAPQLSVRLESQGKSKEPLPEAGGSNVTELVPSFIVLPRIIYLPSDPLGSLTDYYNIQPLNGSTLKKTDVTVTCTGPGTLPASGDLYTSPNKLTKGLYTCTATATGHSSVPFWVHVGDDTRSTKVISFTDESQEMGASSTAYIKLNVPTLGEQLVVNAYCPDVDNDAWEYVSFGGNGITVSREGTSCTITLPATSSPSTPTLATVKTNNAVEGSMVFHILPGEGYIPGAPSSSQLYIQSIAQLNRIEAYPDDITAYCNTHQGCPVGDLSNWPDCDVAGVWVEPTGTEFINKVANNSWAIMVGNSQPVRLQNVSNNNNDCVVIIPEDNFIEEVTANNPYYLRASAKATTRTFKVGFKGNVKGKNPVITVYIGSRQEQCSYNDASESGDSTKTCTITTFKGESVAAKLTDNNDAEDFRHWTCTGTSCPTTDPIVSSMEYDSFTISENGTELIAVFGEADKHCFFDEFKRESVECDAIDTEYCIDKCDDDATSVCTAADATGLFTNAKWHLISGILSQIITGSSGEIHIDKSVIKKKKQSAREPIVVMSTVNAGVIGTLKALINVPRATSSYDKSAVNIKKSGFMLRANKYGNDYFMLNLYENSNGVLEAQLTRGSTSLSNTLTNKNDQTAYVSNSKMVMVTAEFTSQDTLKVRASVGNYYGGSPTEYECAFVLTEFNNTLADAAHEYVGFSLADPNFKIYGIGWKSGTYNSECYDTYPTVKCSFAAVATDGVIKTGEDVVPWVGHSGWFDSKGCSPIYYYYNGDDACGSPGVSGTTCNVYNFDSTKSGAHGYTDNNGVEHRTAKAWLGSCTNADGSAMAWANNAVQQAHCGAFWTGKFSECAAHQDLFSGSKSVNYGLEETVVFDNKQNLRAATLHIELENTGNNEVEIWLVSESDNWGESDHESHSVKMNGNSATFDVIQEFATGSSGFDPENVKQIVFKNHGITSATLTSITSSCENAIGITYCTATFDGDKWNVMTQVTNKEMIASQQVTATVEGTDHTLNVTKQATGDDGIAWNGNVAALSIPDNPYDCCQDKSYRFNAKIVGTSGQEETKECDVSPRKIGKIGVNCSVVGSIASGARFPTFNIDFNGCPGEGCGYEVFLDNTSFASGIEKTSARHSANQSQECKVTAGCEHTYKVRSTANPELFDECSANFKVLRKEEDVPPTVTCGISTSPNTFSTDPVFTGNRLYFLARNTESVDKTFNVTLKRGDATEGTATLQKWSQITNVKDLGTGLAKGTYTYSLYVGDEKVCDASVTVNDISGACNIGGRPYAGQQISVNVSGVNANTQFTWTFNNSSKTIDCGTANCWNNTINAPTTPGTYAYSVTKGANKICEGSVSIEPILSCAVDPATVGKGESYTFTANAAVSCWNCSFTDDAGTTDNNLGVQENASLTRTKVAGNSIGNKTLRFNCNSCNNNTSASCTASLNVVKAKPSFSCADNLKATVNKDNNVKIRLTGIAGCDDSDCSYSISGIGSTATVYTGCTNTNCALSAITNKTTTAGNSATYTVSLTNSEGTTSHNCSVEFITGQTCATIASNITSSNVTITGSLENGCADITTNRICSGEVQIEVASCKGKTGTWNGTSFTLNDNNNGYYRFASNPAPRKENNLDIPDCPNATINKIYLDNCADYKPVISCDALSTSKTKGSSVTIKPTVENCNNNTPCSYTITGSGTNITHSDKDWTSGSNMESLATVTEEGQKTYKLTVANAHDESEECEFTINYTNPDASTDVYKSTDFVANEGNTKIKISGGPNSPSGCQIYCNANGNVGTITVTIGSWSSNGNNSAGGDISNKNVCQNGSVSTVTLSHNATCQMNWW